MKKETNKQPNVTKTAEVKKTNEVKKPNTVDLKQIEIKLDKIINLLETQKPKNIFKLSEMSLADLSNLKEHLAHNILKNNYPGGNDELKVSSNNLIIRIDEEANKRINLYE
jgi:hypothetical protein